MFNLESLHKKRVKLKNTPSPSPSLQTDACNCPLAQRGPVECSKIIPKDESEQDKCNNHYDKDTGLQCHYDLVGKPCKVGPETEKCGYPACNNYSCTEGCTWAQKAKGPCSAIKLKDNTKGETDKCNKFYDGETGLLCNYDEGNKKCSPLPGEKCGYPACINSSVRNKMCQKEGNIIGTKDSTLAQCKDKAKKRLDCNLIQFPNGNSKGKDGFVCQCCRSNPGGPIVRPKDNIYYDVYDILEK